MENEEVYLEEDINLSGKFDDFSPIDEDELRYCDECGDPLLEEDTVYEGICNHCGDGNGIDEI